MSEAAFIFLTICRAIDNLSSHQQSYSNDHFFNLQALVFAITRAANEKHYLSSYTAINVPPLQKCRDRHFSFQLFTCEKVNEVADSNGTGLKTVCLRQRRTNAYGDTQRRDESFQAAANCLWETVIPDAQWGGLEKSVCLFTHHLNLHLYHLNTS